MKTLYLLFTFNIVVLFLFTASAQDSIVIRPDKDALLLMSLKPGQQGYANTNYGQSQQFFSTEWTSTNYRVNQRSLIDFDLSSIPKNAEIVSAKLYLYAYNVSANNDWHMSYAIMQSSSYKSNESYLRRITKPWNETTVTYNNQPATSTQNQVLLGESTTHGQNYIAEIKDLVNDMMNESTSYGLMMILKNEQKYAKMAFCSSDHPDVNKRPKLVVKYNIRTVTVDLSPDKDAWLYMCMKQGYEYIANTNYGTSQKFYSSEWTYMSTRTNQRSLIAFDFSQIPAGAVITEAKLSLYAYNVSSNNDWHMNYTIMQSSTYKNNASYLQRVTSPWDESTVTYNNQPSTTAINQVLLGESVTHGQNYIDIDIKTLIQNMIDDPANSYGLMLKLQSEQRYAQMAFCSSDHPDVNKRPKLKIKYLEGVYAMKNEMVPIESGNYNQYIQQMTDEYMGRSNKNNDRATFLVTANGHFRLNFLDEQNQTNIGFDARSISPNYALGQQRQQTALAAYNYLESILDLSNLTDQLEIDFRESWDDSPLHPPTPGFENALGVGGTLFPYTTPGFYGGVLYDHKQAGHDVNPGIPDGHITINFKTHIQTSTGIISLLWNNDFSQTAFCHSFDLYTVILHEAIHTLGFLSRITEINDLPACDNSFNAFSIYDREFLYYANAGSQPFPSSSAGFTKLVNVTPPSINASPSLTPGCLHNGNIWFSNSIIPSLNYPVESNNLYINTLALSSFRKGTTLSHPEDAFASYTYRAHHSPGYVKSCVMYPFLARGVSRREISWLELRMLQQIGYQLNSVFNNTIDNTKPENGGFSNGQIIANTPPYTTKQIVPPDNLTNRDYPDINNISNTPADFITTNGTPVVINLWQDASLHDNDNDQIKVYGPSLFNIRGCGNYSSGGNNHDQLVLSNNNRTITFTPRNNFIGRAQFGFLLWDGKETGSFMVYTIDLNKGGTFNNGTELIINGGFEEGTEIRTTDNTGLFNYYGYENINNSIAYYLEGTVFADAHPFSWRSWDGWHPSGVVGTGNGAAGEIVENSNNAKNCTYSFGNDPFGIPGNSNWNHPFPVLGSQNHRYHLLARYDNVDNYILAYDLLPNHYYKISFDFYYPQNSTYPFVLTHRTNGSVSVNATNILNLNYTNQGNWQNMSAVFQYCGTVISNLLSFYLNNPALTQDFLHIDNISLTEVSPPTLTVDLGDDMACIESGDCITLVATPSIYPCDLQYLWSTSATTQSITVCPTTPTTYSVTVTGASQTATDQIEIDVDNCCIPDNATIIIPDGTVINTDITYFYPDIVSIQGNVTINANVGFGGSINNAPLEIYLQKGSVLTINGYVSFCYTKMFCGGNSKIIITGTGQMRCLQKKTTYSTEIFTSCGNIMWDGIYVQPGGKLNIVAAEISKAKNAVVCDNCSQLVLYAISFIDNYKNIYIKNIPNGFTNCLNALEIIGNNNLLPPYSGQRTYSGFELENYNQDISVPCFCLANTFSNMDYGIYSTNSNPIIVDCDFNNISNGIYCINSDITESNNTFTNVTNQITGCTKKKEILEEGETNIQQKPAGRLYPVPASDKAYIDYELTGKEDGLLRISDLAGKMIVEYKLSANLNHKEIDTRNLTSGVYFYSVIIKDKPVVTDKLVIIR